MKKAFLIIVIILILVLGGYFLINQNGRKGISSPQPSSTPQPSPVVTAVNNEQRIVIQNFSFQPEAVSVKVGATVVWKNDDSVPHQIASDESGIFGSSILGRGQEYSFTFDKAGEYDYRCAIHLSMKGKITVTE